MERKLIKGVINKVMKTIITIEIRSEKDIDIKQCLEDFNFELVQQGAEVFSDVIKKEF